MKKGQIAPRLLMLLFSWVMLIVALALMFFFQALDKDDSVALPGAVNSPNIEATLSGFLRQTVEINGENVPMAELLAMEAMLGKSDRTAEEANKFLAKIQTATKKQMIITLQDNTRLRYGARAAPGKGLLGRSRGSASTEIPLPDGTSLKIEYKEFV